METIASRVDATSAAYAANREAQLGLARELKERLAAAALGGPEKSRERHVARGKLLPRERIDRLLDDGSPFLEIAPLAANGMYDDDSPGRRRDCRDRPGPRPPGPGHLQRRHGQGRHLLPDDGEEAPPGAGNRAGEPAALHLPRGLGRGVPAQAGRGLPGQGALRPDLLQPGEDVRGEDPADRLRDGLLHRRRRLRPRDERRDRDRPQPGHHLPGRPAAGEGRDRRDRHGRGARRRRRALEDLRRHGPPGRER